MTHNDVVEVDGRPVSIGAQEHTSTYGLHRSVDGLDGSCNEINTDMTTQSLSQVNNSLNVSTCGWLFIII